jgi:hypothetical protein
MLDAAVGHDSVDGVTNGNPPPAVALFRTKEAATPGNGFPEGRDFSKNRKDD